MPKLPPGLESERGSPGLVSVMGRLLDTWEETAELVWPNSVVVYDRMRRTDGHIGSILRAITLPLKRTRWKVVGDEVDPVVRDFVEEELGLAPDEHGRRRRRREGVNFVEVLHHALLMLPLGFSPLEQVFEVGPPPPALAEALASRRLRQVAHLRKLAWRPPRTITRIDVAPDGGLKALWQQVPLPNGMYEERELTVDRLVVFVNEKEGSDWTGTSILRASYKDWLIKDGLIRLGPMAVERGGMGLPVVKYPDGADEQKALSIAKNARAGEEAGIAMPIDWDFKLEGISGQVKDELPLLKYHDQEMSRNALAMFLDLGHDRGARSLGETFVDFFLMSEMAVAEYVGEIFTEHVARDLVEINFGAQEPYPQVVADEISEDAALTAEAIKALVEAGVLTPDDNLETEIRRRHRLPARPGEPTGPPSEDIGGIDEVPVDDGGEPGPETPPPGQPPAPGPGAAGDGQIYVRPHVRRRPGVAFSGITFDQETRKIAENRQKLQSQRKHKFVPAEWTHPNGHPRCYWCGGEERIGGFCDGSAATLPIPGIRGVEREMGLLNYDELEARLEAAKARLAELRRGRR
jgi:hypothetical protein